MSEDTEIVEQNPWEDWESDYPEYDGKALLNPSNVKKSESGFVLVKASESPLEVNFATNKLRQLRDHFDQHGLVSVNERVLAPDLRSKLMGGRVPRDVHGNFTREAIQQTIARQPKTQFNWSTGTFDRAVGATQRHSNELSNVLRLEITPEQERQLREAGVWDSFLRMQQASQQSGHPANDKTAGWVRWTGDKSGVHLDELQSDFGRPWPGMLAEAGRRDYGVPPDQLDSWVARHSHLYPEDQRKVIQKILFGNKHPGEVLHEGFNAWARGPGELTGAPLHVWQPEAKLHIANIDPDPRGHFDPTRPVPGHLAQTYRDIPEKRGMAEGKYGEIPTQTNPKLKRMPKKVKVGEVGGEIQWQPSNRTYKDQVRAEKSEIDVNDLKKSIADAIKRVIGSLE